MTRSISLWLPRSVTLLLGISLLHCSDGPTAPRPVASVTVEPGVGTLVVGGSVQLTATALDAGGAVLPGRVVTWTTSDGGVATVSSTGLVTGASDGSATVTASSETKSGTAAMTVLTVVFASVAAGSLHTCGVAAGGQALCWGSNGYGQLGNGDQTRVQQLSPVLVTGGTSFAAVSAASGLDSGLDDEIGVHSCGVTAGGAGYCWGYNSFGQVGNGDVNGPDSCLGIPCAAAPVAVAGGRSFAAISAGVYHSCAVTASGEAYCWGHQGPGELGNGQAEHQPLPVLVSGGISFAQVSAGFHYTCGVTSAGAAYCWGLNRAGQLGDGTKTHRSTPVPVAGGVSFAAVSAGGDHTCGVASTGAAYCWGSNFSGELGDGSNITQTSPALVSGGASFAAVSSGQSYSCGMTAAGTLYCWGGNGEGQLGDGTTISRNVPTKVLGQP